MVILYSFFQLFILENRFTKLKNCSYLLLSIYTSPYNGKENPPSVIMSHDVYEIDTKLVLSNLYNKKNKV